MQNKRVDNVPYRYTQFHVVKGEIYVTSKNYSPARKTLTGSKKVKGVDGILDLINESRVKAKLAPVPEAKEKYVKERAEVIFNRLKGELERRQLKPLIKAYNLGVFNAEYNTLSSKEVEGRLRDILKRS